MILMIDNFDSFTFNLVQYLGELGADVLIKRNDEITIADIEALSPSCLMISPGPCSPDEAGISLAAIEAFAGKLPIFGVCLGHQSIAQVFGGKVVRADRLMHGKTSPVFHNQQTIYRGIEVPFLATRYHSLIVERETLPDCFEVSSWTEEGEIMGIKHRLLPIEGVQFHPESIMTSAGKDLLLNFLNQHGLIQQGGKHVVY
ncbi:aminodeoxychorismate/anthranilate synthase component II [Cytobacillus kochii]|uniref:aminodeoxychorismate/anthranilate synthase component II n=1 Tax=Cytobacillus kochii TaxID=859143 RepID=UPI001CD2F063|nr:aminodeoxychorismate/anthranilate synthase component II [Cytobacillus kochii]MCA1029168.1 aminodeoxychorismate/anthranilate synthase component II [Cytobacillus kochii]MCM3324944.1 aminodeoxychorismate/anthranilate synthase component II [Cytobacillus kochii]MCM3347380.1 aminodeoxychorismate/anthranilate synthase component II [Cytobacillus kochii]MDM5205499.1 aminodeoxychorismate/anthranilate synthase component II [Cytobacillus kochii]